MQIGVISSWAISRAHPARGVEPRGAYYNYVKMANWGATDMSNFDGSRCAAVVFEVGLNLPDRKWLDGLMAWCREEGVLLIADEVVTALRYGLGGACESCNIRPDLVCMGKALGNGLPVNALIGRREHMDWFARRDPVFCSSTHWGEAAGLAAASWVLDNFGEEEDFVNSMLALRLKIGRRWGVSVGFRRIEFRIEDKDFKNLLDLDRGILGFGYSW